MSSLLSIAALVLAGLASATHNTGRTWNATVLWVSGLNISGLRCEHDFTNMCATLQSLMCLTRLSQRKSGIYYRRDLAGVQ